MKSDDIRKICQALVNTAEIWFDDGCLDCDGDGYFYCDICNADNSKDRSKDVEHKEDCAVLIADKWLEEN